MQRKIISKLAIVFIATAPSLTALAQVGDQKKIPQLSTKVMPATPVWACGAVRFYFDVLDTLGASNFVAELALESLLPGAILVAHTMNAHPALQREAAMEVYRERRRHLVQSIEKVIAAASARRLTLSKLKTVNCISGGDGREVTLILDAPGTSLSIAITYEALGPQFIVTEVSMGES